jgi:hypothetical protein
MKNHPRQVWYRIAVLTLLGVAIFGISIFLETRMHWPWDIMQSLGAAGVILVLGLIRGAARKEESDQLWMIAFWRWLTEQPASTAMPIHTGTSEQALATSDTEQPGQTGEAELEDSRSPQRATSGDMAPAGRQTAPGPSLPTARGEEVPAARVTERDGSLVKTTLWFHERHLRDDPPQEDTDRGEP